MIQDMNHAGLLQERWERLHYRQPVETTPELDQMWALKTVIEACGFDIPDALFDEIEYAIRECVGDDENGEDEVRAQLRQDISFNCAMLMLPDMAQAWDERQAALRLRADAKRAVIAFIAGLFPQVAA